MLSQKFVLCLMKLTVSFFFFFLHNNSGNVQQNVYKETDLLSVHRVKRVTTNPLSYSEYDC